MEKWRMGRMAVRLSVLFSIFVGFEHTLLLIMDCLLMQRTRMFKA